MDAILHFAKVQTGLTFALGIGALALLMILSAFVVRSRD